MRRILTQNFKGQLTRRRHIPQRTCAGCREKRAKRELIRIVRTHNNGVEIDLSGKKPGRGAYLCPKLECWELGIKKNRLEYALRVKITLENREQLLKDGAELLKGYLLENQESETS